MRAWEIVSEGGVKALSLADRSVPEPGPGQVQVRVRASSINYRDLITVEDPASRNLTLPAVPNSDCAGEITALGPDVAGFAVGDRVAGCFFQDWQAGSCSARVMASALGGALDGVLAEQVVLSAGGVVPIPDHLSFEEAATLPCAALTAWHALTQPAPVLPGETVLLLGTGGVSVFALQFCGMMGARTIVTSSRDEKLTRMRAMGADETINYRQTSDWERRALELTGGVGVDRVIEVGGPGTLQKSIKATRIGGQISLIGVLTGVTGTIVPTAILGKSITVRGIYVGSRDMFTQMNLAISHHKLHPVIDRTVEFEAAQDAYRAMRATEHLGKIVIRA